MRATREAFDAAGISTSLQTERPLFGAKKKKEKQKQNGVAVLPQRAANQRDARAGLIRSARAI